MFQSTRLKLTAWYLSIIMLISLSFSIVIYKMLTIEVERFIHLQRTRIERRLLEGKFFPPEIRFRGISPPFSIMDPELMDEIKYRLILILVFINGGILVISGGLGYILAGRTLMPIQEMINEQNRFIADASHELRTPLTSLKSVMEVSLRDKKLTLADARLQMTENIEEVNKLQSLSDELLKLVQYQKPQSQVAFEKLSLQEIINIAIRQIEPLAKKRKIKIISTVDDIKIECNKYELEELMLILLDNAVKYSKNNKTVKVYTVRTDGYIKISVADYGIGIAKKDIPHVFDRFFRSDTARSKTDIGGYGLGLSIAKKIVDLNNGSITVESRLNLGSTFTVSLPKDQSFHFQRPSFFS